MMADAGFDPEQSILLWENMNEVGGARPPEFLSTHPSPESRIAELQRMMPSANNLMQAARAQGRNPDCVFIRQ
jgi:predicted Zn-dependent protease